MTTIFDYIIIGAGAAGPVIASRLSENPENKVLLVEAGGENTTLISRAPAAFSKVWKTSYDWNYETVNQKNLNDRVIYQPRGKVVGGSTAINVGFWMRGIREDYQFLIDFCFPNATYQHILSLFKKIEDTDKGPTSYRGKGGMVHLSDSAFPTPFVYTLLEAFEQSGLGTQGDFNAENPYQADIVQKDYVNNVRRTPADSYLNNQVRQRANLTIMPHTFVTKILINDELKAFGIEVERNNQATQYHANEEIILSAGSYNTPQLLKLSGVGPKQELRDLGIPLVVDLPGVGENLVDHISVNVRVISDKAIPDTVFDSFSEDSISEWTLNQTGPATYYTGSTAGFISKGSSESGPEFEIIMSYQPAINGNENFFDVKKSSDKKHQGYTISTILSLPKSRGNVLLSSANPHDKVLINPNYLSDERDLNQLIKGVRLVQKIINTDKLKPYTAQQYPVVEATDEELTKMIKQEGSTVFHPVGTAKMGDVISDPMAVVDGDFKVKGVGHLRVADASILPELVRGHTMAPTVLIGEIAAEKIRESQLESIENL